MSAIEAAREVLRDWDEGKPRQYSESIDALSGLLAEHEELIEAHAGLKAARRSRRRKDAETIERLTKENAELREQVYKLGIEILIEANK